MGILNSILCLIRITLAAKSLHDCYIMQKFCSVAIIKISQKIFGNIV